ncbi:MAG TPA: tryptophan--tRNA ligase [Candidatus Paceibacterota bacterium]|jgi:tryptophanyl-tRNA synthetase|nr:tryptophan--tRNA ligase [Candidatus Paceibacterota bacterium]
MAKKIMLSGVKPTGSPHIGNYFGAMKQFVELSLSRDYECLVMIADYHALNFIQNAEEMRENITAVLLDYMAIGLDPKKVTIFKQSDVSEHAELAWIFDTLTTMPYLMRAHAFKDAEAKNKEISVGTFNYPMLMAADILLYDADVVPVGADQKQHVEIARDTAMKFNNAFGETFKLPEPMIIQDVAIVPGTDGRKMSKSYGNTIPLFASQEEIKKAVMGIVTDSGTGIPEHVYAIHKLFRPAAELLPIYEAKAGKYKELKEMLIEDIEKFIAPMRERRKKLEKNIPKALGLLKKGGARAKKIAEKKMKEVREKIGVRV